MEKWGVIRLTGNNLGTAVQWILLHKRLFCVYGSVIMFLAIVATRPSEGQEKARNDASIVRGVVISGNDSTAIPGAHVYFGETTIGTLSDMNGEYKLAVPNGMSDLTLVVSMVGYETATIEDASSVYNVYKTIQLVEKRYLLDELLVVADRSEWLQKKQLLEQNMFLSVAEEQGCSIVNINDVLIDFVDEESQSIVAFSPETMVIKNDHLGYDLRVADPHITIDKGEMTLTGELYFEDRLTSGKAVYSSKEIQKWIKNRKISWQGSIRHFWSSLIKGNLFEEGFDVAFVREPGDYREYLMGYKVEDVVEIRVADVVEQSYSIKYDKTLKISYKRETESKRYRKYLDSMGFRQQTSEEMQSGRLITKSSQTSWLAYPTDFLLVSANGLELRNHNIRKYGQWAFERVCRLLPSDYRPG